MKMSNYLYSSYEEFARCSVVHEHHPAPAMLRAVSSNDTTISSMISTAVEQSENAPGPLLRAKQQQQQQQQQQRISSSLLSSSSSSMIIGEQLEGTGGESHGPVVLSWEAFASQPKSSSSSSASSPSSTTPSDTPVSDYRSSPATKPTAKKDQQQQQQQKQSSSLIDAGSSATELVPLEYQSSDENTFATLSTKSLRYSERGRQLLLKEESADDTTSRRLNESIRHLEEIFGPPSNDNDSFLLFNESFRQMDLLKGGGNNSSTTMTTTATATDNLNFNASSDSMMMMTTTTTKEKEEEEEVVVSSSVQGDVSKVDQGNEVDHSWDQLLEAFELLSMDGSSMSSTTAGLTNSSSGADDHSVVQQQQQRPRTNHCRRRNAIKSRNSGNGGRPGLPNRNASKSPNRPFSALAQCRKNKRDMLLLGNNNNNMDQSSQQQQQEGRRAPPPPPPPSRRLLPPTKSHLHPSTLSHKESERSLRPDDPRAQQSWLTTSSSTTTTTTTTTNNNNTVWGLVATPKPTDTNHNQVRRARSTSPAPSPCVVPTRRGGKKKSASFSRADTLPKLMAYPMGISSTTTTTTTCERRRGSRASNEPQEKQEQEASHLDPKQQEQCTTIRRHYSLKNRRSSDEQLLPPPPRLPAELDSDKEESDGDGDDEDFSETDNLSLHDLDSFLLDVSDLTEETSLRRLSRSMGHYSSNDDENNTDQVVVEASPSTFTLFGDAFPNYSTMMISTNREQQENSICGPVDNHDYGANGNSKGGGGAAFASCTVPTQRLPDQREEEKEEEAPTSTFAPPPPLLNQQSSDFRLENLDLQEPNAFEKQVAILEDLKNAAGVTNRTSNPQHSTSSSANNGRRRRSFGCPEEHVDDKPTTRSSYPLSPSNHRRFLAGAMIPKSSSSNGKEVKVGVAKLADDTNNTLQVGISGIARPHIGSKGPSSRRRSSSEWTRPGGLGSSSLGSSLSGGGHRRDSHHLSLESSSGLLSSASQLSSSFSTIQGGDNPSRQQRQNRQFREAFMAKVLKSRNHRSGFRATTSKARTTPPIDADKLITLHSGENVYVNGISKLWMDIALGNPCLLSMCDHCREILQVPGAATLAFCPDCSDVSQVQEATLLDVAEAIEAGTNLKRAQRFLDECLVQQRKSALAAVQAFQNNSGGLGSSSLGSNLSGFGGGRRRDSYHLSLESSSGFLSSVSQLSSSFSTIQGGGNPNRPQRSKQQLRAAYMGNALPPVQAFPDN